MSVRRETPIPVYAEMGSTNPVFILPRALSEKPQLLAKAFSSSVTLGVGQFCTNPGMLIYEIADAVPGFIQQLEEEFGQTL